MSHEPEINARMRLVMRRRFQLHFYIFAAVMAALVVAWLLLWVAAGIGFPWFLVLALGWGVALAIEFVEAYGPGEVTAREVRAEIARDRREAAERARRLREYDRPEASDESRALEASDESPSPRDT